MAKTFKDHNGNKIVVQSLTFGYLEDVENGIIEESMGDAILDATNLTTDQLRALTRIEANEIFEIIKRETYPELYNEDGTEKDFDEESVESDKKKV